MDYLKSTLTVVFFAGISFLPHTILDKYKFYVLIFLVIFLLILFLNKNNLRRLFNIQDWPLWLFLICLLAGTASATDRSLAFRTYFYLAGVFLFIFYIGKAIFFKDKYKNMIVVTICICSGLVAFLGILELCFGKNILYENFITNPYYSRYVRFYSRPMSTQLNPAVLGSYLLGCLPFNFYLFRNKSSYLKMLGVFSSLLCVFIIILTFSRGVFLGLIALLLFYLWSMQKKRLLAAFLLFLILLVSVSSFQKNVNLNRFGLKRLVIGSYDSIISEYRMSRVKMTAKMLKDHPFFGIGFNHFRLRFKEYCDNRDINEAYEFMIPDNMYLTFLAEAGIIGTSGFLAFLIILLKKGLKQLKELGDENKKRMLLLVLSALIGLLVNMGAYELFYWNNPYMLFCLICGFIQGATKNHYKVVV